MFNNCRSLKNLDIHNFVFKNSVEINYMFSNCSRALRNKIKKQNKAIYENENKDYRIFPLLAKAELGEES